MKLRLPKPKAGVRPTSSKVRDAIFNMVPAEVLEGGRVLDLYAGTGALGYEALERGAAFVDFVEKDAEMCRRIREALADAELSGMGHVYCAAAANALRFLTGSYAVVFMDPPYADPRIGVTMALVAGSGLLKRGGLLVVEHSARVAVPEAPSGMAKLKDRRYGDAAVAIYQQMESE